MNNKLRKWISNLQRDQEGTMSWLKISVRKNTQYTFYNPPWFCGSFQRPVRHFKNLTLKNIASTNYYDDITKTQEPTSNNATIIISWGLIEWWFSNYIYFLYIRIYEATKQQYMELTNKDFWKSNFNCINSFHVLF